MIIWRRIKRNFIFAPFDNLLILLISLFIPVYSIENLNPRPSQFINEVESIPRFTSPVKTQDRFILLDVNADYILIGGRDALYNLSTSRLNTKLTIQWKAPGQTIEECLMKGKSEAECHNFVRVAAKLQNGRILLCGTHAFSPQCREYEFIQSEDRFAERGQFNGQAISPYDPLQNSSYVYLPDRNDIFVGAISDFSATDPLIYRRRLSGGDSLRTQKDDRVIDEPNFVGSFSYGDYVYFWYREKASDALDNNRETQIYSRVGRVCANDPGGPSPAQDRWSSFLKLRLNCSVPGDGDISPFYFNEIQSISDPIPYGGNSGDALVYAIFQTSRSLPMSAVCAFRMSQIDSVFDHGRFKTQRSPTSLWTPSQKFYSNPSERPGQCGPDASNRLSDMAPISKNPLMYETVSTIGNSPLLVEGPNRADLTSIAVTADALSIRRQKHNAIFVGRTDGTLIDLSQNGTAVLVETIKVFPLLTPIIGIRLLPNTSNNNIPSLIVSSLSQVANIPLQHCSLAENCGRCVALRDPHCAWDIELRRCVNRKDWNSGSYVQNVLLGVSEQCPGFTSILGNAESGAAYVIDEDVLGGGGLQNLSPLNNRLNDPLSDDSDAAHIAEPTQRGIDLAGLYSTGSLSVLVLLVLVATLFGFVIGWRIAKWRTLSEFTRNNPASSGASTSSNSSDYADGIDGSARARLARQDSTEQKMMMLAGNNVYSVGPRSCVCNGGDTVSLVMSQRGGVHHLVPLTSISTGASRANSGFATPRHDARCQTTSLGSTLPRDYRIRKVYL
uniref:Sema domain-containing protein n=2 Tax=Meloidogyne enterolobii TaxID=390850 RepID=A0A6V7UZZ1_MELEN|nr:unnamed protein product [Meloidogyne enterolobii]